MRPFGHAILAMIASVLVIGMLFWLLGNAIEKSNALDRERIIQGYEYVPPKEGYWRKVQCEEKWSVNIIYLRYEDGISIIHALAHAAEFIASCVNARGQQEALEEIGAALAILTPHEENEEIIPIQREDVC